VGCSTGEEAYTLSMIIEQFLQSRAISKSCYLAVTGMDISLPALTIARKAIYEHYKIRHVPEYYLHKFFIKQKGGHYKISNSLKKRTCFASFNLIDMAKTSFGTMDIIFCQNVLIYFKSKIRKDIIYQLVEHLKPGGFLVLGAGETLGKPHPELKKIDFPQTLAFVKKYDS